jgi:hypothetical protein
MAADKYENAIDYPRGDHRVQCALYHKIPCSAQVWMGRRSGSSTYTQTLLTFGGIRPECRSAATKFDCPRPTLRPWQTRFSDRQSRAVWQRPERGDGVPGSCCGEAFTEHLRSQRVSRGRFQPHDGSIRRGTDLLPVPERPVVKALGVAATSYCGRGGKQRAEPSGPGCTAGAVRSLGGLPDPLPPTPLPHKRGRGDERD